MKTRCVAVVSGGMDSVTLAYWLRQAYQTDMLLLSFDYGQRHVKELSYAKATAERLVVKHRVIDLRSLTHLLGGSALTDRTIAVPDGHYEDESMKQTVVPNRNAIMLSIAYGIAVAANAEVVGVGVHSGDHAIYPDCRPEFIGAFREMQRHSIGDHQRTPRLETPFLDVTKAGIVSVGIEIGVPYQHTWSCYKGGAKHCGTCGTCVERKEAFADAGVSDPTEYAEYNADAVE